MHSVEMKNESVNKNFSIGHPFGIKSTFWSYYDISNRYHIPVL